MTHCNSDEECPTTEPKCWKDYCRRNDDTCNNAYDCDSLACDVISNKCFNLSFVTKERTDGFPECRDGLSHARDLTCFQLCQDVIFRYQPTQRIDALCDQLVCDTYFDQSYCKAGRLWSNDQEQQWTDSTPVHSFCTSVLSHEAAAGYDFARSATDLDCQHVFACVWSSVSAA